MDRPSAPSRYAEAFWPLAFLPVVVGVCVVRLVQRPSATGIVALVMVGLLAAVVELLIGRELRRRWRGENPGLLGRALRRIEQDKWSWAVLVALWLSVIAAVLKWPLGDSVMASIIRPACSFVLMVWVLAVYVDRAGR